MAIPRFSGVLLHPTSLPGPYGIGDLGEGVDDWLRWLSTSGTRWWQFLPLGPTGFADSPYQCFSSIAGNPLLISPDRLVEQGLLNSRSIDTLPRTNTVDFAQVMGHKNALLDRAAHTLHGSAEEQFRQFRRDNESWLTDFALFMALKERHGGRPWFDWPVDLRDRQPEAINSATKTLRDATRRHAFRQWVFFEQWRRVREVATSLGVGLFGDMPLYVAADSADVWTRRDLFEVGPTGRPTHVAGVPPDYFSPTGQLWGNPIFRWEAHAGDGFAWWIERIERTMQLVDMVRIDHFRGLADYWEIPADAPTAETGRWVDGPGADLFEAIEHRLGPVPIIAEDLGDLSPAVRKLRDRLGLPGMAILQFAWDGDADNPFLPHHLADNVVVYTGTHDNDTTLGWLQAADAAERERALRYLDTNREGFVSAMIETAWASNSVGAAIPFQDALGLPSSARMNTPGTTTGNWTWRMSDADASMPLAEWLLDLNVSHGRRAAAI